MAQPTPIHSHRTTAPPPRDVPRLTRSELLRNRAAKQARAAGNFLLTWSIPLLVTAAIFAAVILWFWWTA